MANSRDLNVNLVGNSKGLERAFSGIGGKLSGKAKAGLVAIGAAAATAVRSGVTRIFDEQDVTAGLEASLGLSPEVAEKFGRIAGNVYNDAWGDSLAGVGQTVAAVASSFDGIGDAELESLTEKAEAFAQVFGVDVSEAVTSAGTLLSSGLVDDGTEAFDVLTRAMQEVPAGLRGEILDATEEYSQFFDALGIEGEEAFGLLVAAAEDGQFGIDKTGDAIKEFTIRATDMSTASKDAFEAIGLDAQEMSNQILAGGDTAADAFQQIVDGLLAIEDPTEQANAAIALFGTPLEDLGVNEIPAFLESLSGMEDGLGNVEGAADRMADTVGGTARARVEAFKRKAIDKLATGFVALLDAGDKTIKGLKRFFRLMIDGFGDMRDGILNLWTDKLLPFFKSIPRRAVSAIGNLGSTLLQKGRALLGGLRSGAVDVMNGIVSWAGGIPGRIARGIKFIAGAGGVLGTVGKGMLRAVHAGAIDIMNGIISWAGNIPGRIRDGINFIAGAGGALGTVGKSMLRAVHAGAIEVANGIVSWAGNIPGRIRDGINFISGAGGALGTVGKNMMGAVRSGLEEIAGDIVSFVAGLPGDIADSISGALTGVLDRLRTIGGNIAGAIAQGFISAYNAIPILPDIGGGGVSIPEISVTTPTGTNAPPTASGIAAAAGIPQKIHSGGVVLGGPNDELLALLQGGETVRTVDQESELAAMMSGRDGGGDVIINATVNMPPGSNGEDVYRSLVNLARRRGPLAIPVR